MDDWLRMSAVELGAGIKAGTIDPVELTQTYLAAIEAHPLKDRIYARVTNDRAMAEANAASKRAKAGTRLSDLDGVPVSWKDLFDTKGVATEAGSALLKGRVPVEDAEVLKAATALGLVCLGKTHMSELAFSGLGLNPVTATPPCVNNANAVSGGSSSGAAASVAFGLAAAAVGSDTGGSVRIPSAWNDLVGLKTTIGRVPVAGSVPLCARFDTIGPLCRSVADAASMLAALEGTKPVDLGGASLRDMNFMVLDTVAFDDIRPEPLRGFETAVEKLKAAGATISHNEIPQVAEAMPLSAVVFAAEAYGTWRETIEAAPEKMFPEILERFRSGADVSASDFVAAWQKIDRLQQDYAKAAAGYDAVLVPTSPILPPEHDRLLSDHDYYVTENLLALRNTRIGNLMGLAVLTLPTGTPSAGISFMGLPGSEEHLLKLGHAAEAVLK